MVRTLLLGLAVIVAVIIVFAILAPILHFAFLILIAVAIAFAAFRVGRRRRG
ncbi:MAG: hypothetical protein ACRDNZ_17405 [Streptosporangiaceae bacterium]